MKRLLFSLLGVGLALSLAVPVLADHAPEPTAPITDLTLRLCDYPGCIETILVCDGTDVVDFDRLRIETDVHVEDTPSEHWDQRLIVQGVVRVGADGSPRGPEQWAVLVRHANVPAHVGQTFESIQGSQLLSEFDTWLVTTTLDGLESGRHFEESCLFTSD